MIKKIETIIKICTVLSFLAFVLGFFIPEIFPILYTDKMTDIYASIWFGMVFFFGIPVIILTCAIPNSVLKKWSKAEKPDKADINFSDFNELNSKLSAELIRNEYKLYKPEMEYRKDKIFIYYKNHGMSVSYYVIMYSDDEEVETILSEASNALEQCIKEKSKWRNYTISVSSMLCVNKVSSSFYKHLNDTSVTSMREYELRAGYSFGGKTLYIGVSPKDFGIAQVKKMRKFLLKALDISNENLRK